MRFLHPEILLLMFVPALLLGYLLITDKDNISRYISIDILEKITVNRYSLSNKGRVSLMVLSLLMMIIAFSRPVYTKSVDIDRASIVIAVQNSSNFDSVEFKKYIDTIFDKRYLYSIVIYNDNIYPLSGLTKDTDTLSKVVKSINFDIIKSNNIDSDKFNDIINKLYNKDNNILIFFGQEVSVNKNIYTYGINSSRKGVNCYVGGDLKAALNIIKDDINKKVIKKDDIIVEEYSKYFLYLATIFLLLSFISLPKYFYVLMIFYNIEANAFIFDFVYISKGDTLYKKGKYSEALEEYKKISAKTPELYYNIGNCFYKLKNYQEAISNYHKVTTDNKFLLSKTLHNIGNSMFMVGKYDLAIENYEISLKINYQKNTEDNLISLKEKLLKSNPKRVKKVSMKKVDINQTDNYILPIVVR